MMTTFILITLATIAGLVLALLCALRRIEVLERLVRGGFQDFTEAQSFLQRRVDGLEKDHDHGPRGNHVLWRQEAARN